MQNSVSPRQRDSITLGRRTSTGLQVRIVIEPDTIRAYRAEPAEIIMHDYRGGGERVSVEPELSAYFTNEPVMEITKCGNGEYVVDFEAGFERGRITVGLEELTKRSQWPRPNGRAYLRWIGLDPKSAEIVRWLEGSA